MELAFAFLSKAAERSQDGTIHAFGAGFDTLQLTQTHPARTAIAIVAKFHCEQAEKGQEHQIEIEMSDPHGKLEHLTSERVFVREAMSHTLAATLVAAIDAPLASVGDHVFHLTLDGIEVASLPLNVVVIGDQQTSVEAMAIRAQWMHDLGMADDEIAELCDPEKYPGVEEEEIANRCALERMRSSIWSV